MKASHPKPGRFSLAPAPRQWRPLKAKEELEHTAQGHGQLRVTRMRATRTGMTAATPPKTLFLEGAVVVTKVGVVRQATAPGLLALRIQFAGWSRIPVVMLSLRPDGWRRRIHEATLVDDAMHELNWLQDARLRSNELGNCRQDFSCRRLQGSLLVVWLGYTCFLGKMLFSLRAFVSKPAEYGIKWEQPSRSCSVIVR